MPPNVDVRPKNWLEAVVLAMLHQRASYGYELMQRLAAFGAEATNPGTLYRTLRKMERQGWCTSAWETPKRGPARRRYSVTDAGEAYFDLWIAALEEYQRHVNALFDLYTGGRS